MTDYRRAADRALDEAYEEPMGLAEFVDTCFENPTAAADSATYLLRAIEAEGTRTVVEEGEERERYRFFDDPHNGGEHAVLGNTAVLADFVDDLRSVAQGRGKGEKIFWFDGPTATGKSELKRCLINGLRAFSKTPEGRRYTVEWNVAGTGGDRSLSYAEDVDEGDWYESPVRTSPLAVFPEPVRSQLLEDLRAETGTDASVPTDLDPFSQEAYDYLETQYRGEGRRDLFSAVTDERHLRVKNYVVDVGDGIGVLHSEDDGSPKERLVGSWMPGMLQALDSRGRKNPQAFSYDGVLSQGNGLLTVVEDASHHADLLQKLLNVPDEGRVKLDKGIGMDVDTQLLVISNPDLEAELDQYDDRGEHDPLKALKRRLDRHEFGYLTSLSLEAQLIRRELGEETAVWTGDEATVDERVRAPLHLAVRDGETTRERELAPHTVAAAALYSVVTRLDAESLPPALDLVDKAELYDRGYVQDGDERREFDDFDLGGDGDRRGGDDRPAGDGTHGIPVTYTRDTIADLLQTDSGRRHPDLAVEDVVTPDDVLDAMVAGLDGAPVFSRAERGEYADRVDLVREAVRERQEDDVLDALLAEKRVDEETVAEYVEHVYAWDGDEQVETDRGSVDPDPLLMKVFETEHLGRFLDEDYRGNEPTAQVERFRHEKIVTALNRYAWEHRDEGFEPGDVDLSQVPVIQDVLETHSWEDVHRLYPDFDPAQWDEPPADTETARLKAETLDRLTDRGYSRASAELASRAVMREVSDEWA